MNGAGGIIILEGVRGVLTSSERLRGFKKALEEFPERQAAGVAAGQLSAPGGAAR